MSLWAKTQQLPPEGLHQIQTFYGANFPIEIRHYCSDWIETQPWMEVEQDNPEHEEFARGLLDELITLIENKIAELSASEGNVTFFLPLKFRESVSRFKDLYSNNPMGLVRIVKQCLDKDKHIVQLSDDTKLTQEMNFARQQQELNQDILEKINFIQTCTVATENDLTEMQMKQETFVLDYQNHCKIQALIKQIQAQPSSQQTLEKQQELERKKDEGDRYLCSLAKQLLKQRLVLADKHHKTCVNLEVLQKTIIDKELINWKQKQQLAGNGAPFDTGMLNLLHKWCGALAETVWTNRQQILRVQGLRSTLPIVIPPGKEDLLPKLNEKITGLLSTLVTNTFLLETQPPQILKKDSRFSATVCLLVGRKLNIHMSPPSVTATIISESLARSLLKNHNTCKSKTCGEILNNTGTMEYDQSTEQLSITFRNMQLKKIKRADRRGPVAVTEEKFCILFESQFTIAGESQLTFHVWTLSLPVVVTVHGNQECNAMATVLWDNQFAEPGRTPFVVPDKVPWLRLAEMLNNKFTSMSGHALNKENLNYLATKLFGGKVTDDFSQRTITWSQFNKETLQNRNFTFWEWFFAVVKLTKDHLKGPSKDGSILGFISKVDAQERLLTKQTGTFLLRFSDSETGGITIAWVVENKSTGVKEMWNLAPFTAKDFTIRSLSDRIKDLIDLVYLYPDTPKDSAFGNYYNRVSDQITKSEGGYIRPELMTIIPGMMTQNAAPMNMDNPQTPQAYQQTESPFSNLSNQIMNRSDNQIDMIDEDLFTSFSNTDYNPDDIMDSTIGD